MTEVASTSSHGFPSNSDNVWSFQPSDESLAVDFLHPMAAGLAVPDGTRIIADDPYRVEPRELLAAHQRDAAAGAYFFTKKAMLSSKGVRRKRTVGDPEKVVGTWRIQNSKNESSAGRPPTGKIVRWRKTLLSYYNAEDSSTTTGYVMREFELLEDGHGGDCGGRLDGDRTHEFIIAQVKLSEREVSRNKKKRKESAAAACRNSTRLGTNPGTSNAAAAGTHDDDLFNIVFKNISPRGIDAFKHFLNNPEWDEMLLGGDVLRKRL